MKAIEFKNVHFSYTTTASDAQEQDVFATDASFSLNGINFSVEEGEFVAILGHNGSGKSTLARLSNGLLSPSAGEVSVLGMSTAEEKNLFEIRKNVGIVFQNPDNQTVASIVEDDIAFGPENVGIPPKEIEQRISFALKAVGMEAFRNTTVARLSGGQKQRIAIAGVLALKPRVMILDESTAMLDPQGRKEVMDVVLRLNREEHLTVLLITHFPEEALLADRAVVMHEGEIVMEGAPRQVLSKEKELNAYSLTLPRALKICQGLREGGMEIPDAFTAQTLAEEIAKACANAQKQAKNVITEGAGTSSSVLEEETSESLDTERGRVQCKNLSYVYNPSSPFATHALNGVNLEIPSGEFFGIIGQTGSGKSTFVQHLNALLKLPSAEKGYKPKRIKRGKAQPAKTVLKVNGFDLTQKTTNYKELRKRVGMVFQYPEHQLFAETVFEDVAFGLKNFNEHLDERETYTAVKNAMETVGLNFEEIKNRSPFELSGGQKRRVAIAGVIVTKPEILILDEPAAGLDPLGKEEILTLLHTLHKRWCKTVIIVSHDMDEICENCSMAAIFSKGKILAVAPPKELFQSEAISQEAGLDVPFTQKVTSALSALGVEINSDLTLQDFISKTLAYAKMDGAGMRRAPKGGETHA